jgi:hypothetical protein
MKSSIKVDFKGVDAPEGATRFEPVIRVNLEDSEDVRDGLLKAFFEALGGTSSWLSVDYHQDTIDGKIQPARITLTPVVPKELYETIDEIKRRLPQRLLIQNSFENFLITEKLKNYEQFYNTKEELRKHIDSGEVTISIKDTLMYLREYQEIGGKFI